LSTKVEEYDYVIVGSGTAGSTLAHFLSEDINCRVLVLEAGGSDKRFWLKLPVGYFKSIYDPAVSRQFKSVADKGIAGRQMDIPRGRVVGGSSSINGLIFIRGQQQDFDDWAQLGASGWGYQDVIPYFRDIETYDGPSSQLRGSFGPLGVRDLRNENPLCHAWLDAARQYGLPDNNDFNADDTFGIGRYQLTLNGRWRDSAATAFLHPALKRQNLYLQQHCTALGLEFEKERATGIRYQQHGEIKTVKAKREVILAAGAIQTPQLLQLSGIGPPELLSQHNIPVRVAAPGVGMNLQDHLQMRTIVSLTNAKHSLNTQIRNPIKLAGMGLDWLLKGRGPLTVGAGQVGGAACTRYAEDGRPDVQLFVMPLSVDKPGTPLHRYPGFTVSYWQCHPESRGRVAINSADPFDDPQIEMNYLSTPKDCAVMTEGLKMVRQIYDQTPFSSQWKEELIPGRDITSDEAILDSIRQNASTVYHPVGTCKMGNDDNSVVDSELRVKGIEGLRIVDASVMPKITSANTNAATYMIAAKAASMITGG